MHGANVRHYRPAGRRALVFLVASLFAALSCGPNDAEKLHSSLGAMESQESQESPDAPEAGAPAAPVPPRNLAARGGPVILGGDDMTDHGGVSATNVPHTGWLYIQKALESLKPQVKRPNDGFVAVLGAASSTARNNNAGAAYFHTVPRVGLRAEFYDGMDQIEDFFDQLRAGTKRPTIIVVAGTDSNNDLEPGEGNVLADNAVTIADFVNSGGGLLAHGFGTVAYGWLSTLLPGVVESNGCDSTTLVLTQAGTSAFPGLTVTDIRAGPCHSNFSGNLEGLQVLARDGNGGGRNIIIGGASVELPGSISLTPRTASYVIGQTSTHTVTALVRDGRQTPVVGATITFSIISGPNAGQSGTGVSNASGQASFSYSSNGNPGRDGIIAQFVDATGVTQVAPEVEALWEPPPNRPPVANAGGPYSTPEGSSVALSGSRSSDPDGNPLTFAWDLDNDGSFDDATGPSASFVGVDGPKAHTVGLRVCDTANACATTTTSVQVVNVQPTANAGANQTVNRGQTVTLAGRWTDPAGTADNAYTVAWDLNGDGVFDVSGQANYGVSNVQTTAFASAGTYTVSFRVTDKDGASHTDTATITVLNRPPVANAGGPYVTPEGSAVTLSSSGSSDPDGDALTFAWDLDGDGAFDDATGPSASFVGIDGPGTRTVGLRVCDTATTCATTTATVQVLNVPPVANAGADQTVFRNGAVTLTGTWTDPAGAADNAYTVAWDLDGDGTFDVSGQANYGTSSVRTTAFAAAGTYTVSFRVTDKDGASHTDTLTVSVFNRPPVANAGGPYFTLEGASVLVNGSASSDPENDALTFAWDLDGDGAFDDATGPSASFAGIDGPSTHTVGLRVCDTANACATASTTVQVLNVPPVANAGADQTVNRNDTVTLTGTWTDPAGASDNAYTVAWDLNGDGTFDVSSPSSHGQASVSTTSFAAAGTYTVSFRVTDKDGASHTDTVSITVLNQPPVADAGGPYSTPEGSSVTLSGAGSSDPENDALTFAWDLDGDGAFDDATGPSASFAGIDGPSTHTVSLRVCDTANACATTSTTVQVNNVPPVANAGADQTVYRNDTVTLTGTWTDPAGAEDNAYTIAWDLDGDGSFDVTGSANHGEVSVRTTAFAAAGTYTVSFRVTDKDGASHTDTVSITVLNRPPVANAGGPYSTLEGASVLVDGSASSDPESDALTFAWDLDGDGAFDDATGPSASFAGIDGPSTHTVGLRVCDTANACATTTTTVVVHNVTPVPNAGADQTVYRFETVTLLGTWSDPAGAADALYSLAWELTGDGIYDRYDMSSYGVASIETTSFRRAGTYTLSFLVADKDGFSELDTVTITVLNRPPVANAGGPYVTQEGSSVLVDGSASADPENDPLTFAWDLDGDGAFDDAFDPTASFLGVDGPSTHSVALRVCDDGGACSTSTTTVQVNNVPPVANAGADQTVYRNDTVTLTGTWADPAGAADNAYTVAWDLDGDGTFDVSGPASYGIASVRTTRFALEGTYTLSFRVTDKDGASHTDTVSITVLNRPPDCTFAGPSVSRLWPPNHQMVDVSILGVTDGEGDPLVITITSIRQDEPVNTIGDGNTDVDGAGVGTDTAQVRAERSGSKRTPGNGRVYHLGYSVDDGHGGTCSGTVNVGVPHDQGGMDEPVDDGPLYDSTRP
jgi:methionine-rich copper-binding protein CopC